MAGWRSLLTALLLLAAPAVSWAQEDARMQVHIAPQEGESLSLQQAMQQALPILWDRIVVRADRDLLPSKLNPAQFMLKAAPQGNAFIIEFKALIENSPKPIYFTSAGLEDLGVILDMASNVAGGKDRLREKPFIIHYAEPISPLVHSSGAVDKLFMCAVSSAST